MQRKQVELLGLCNTSSPRPSLSRRNTAKAVGTPINGVVGGGARNRGDSLSVAFQSPLAAKLVASSSLASSPAPSIARGCTTPRADAAPRFADPFRQQPDIAIPPAADDKSKDSDGGGGGDRSHRQTCLLSALQRAESLIATLNYYSDRSELIHPEPQMESVPGADEKRADCQGVKVEQRAVGERSP